MPEKLKFENELVVQRLKKIVKKSKERKQTVDACQHSNYASELSEGIRQLKEVIEEFQNIAKNLNGKVKTRRVTAASKTFETEYIKMLNDAKTLLVSSQKKLKSIKQNNLSSSIRKAPISSKTNDIIITINYEEKKANRIREACLV